jgi:heptaprenyl diphosphate synthase
MEPNTPYDTITELLQEDLEAFESRFNQVMQNQADILSAEEMQLYRGGKKIRPILLLLSARMNAPEGKAPKENAPEGKTPEGKAPLPERIIAAAVSLEIAHIGSLIHDDIVDKAPLRRGLPTVNASRGYEFALLIGDLQIMESARVFASFVNTPKDIALMKDYLNTGYTLCKGEIEELINGSTQWEPGVMAARYYRIIDRKTGRLISFACEAGARLVDGLPSQVKAMREFGMFLGRAFQIMDDVLDVVQSTQSAGKAVYTDLREGRLSLPIIYALDAAPPDHPIHKVLREKEYSEEEFKAAASFLKKSNSHLKAYSDARVVIEEAKTQLYNSRDNEYKRALMALADYVVDRNI